MKFESWKAVVLGLAIYCSTIALADEEQAPPQKADVPAKAETQSKIPTQPKEEPGLKIGEKAPDFTGTDDQGNPWKLSDHLGKNHVVVYFYPADFTTGCTRQAITFRDNSNALADAGVTVIGVSGDSVQNHELFKKEWNLNFTLLADEEKQIAEKFGVPVRGGGKVRPRNSEGKPLEDEEGKPIMLERQATFARFTYIIDQDGNIVYKNTRVNPAKDSEEVLKFVTGDKEDAPAKE